MSSDTFIVAFLGRSLYHHEFAPIQLECQSSLKGSDRNNPLKIARWQAGEVFILEYVILLTE